MNFRQWIETDEKDYNYYKHLVLGKLSLNPNTGPEQTLDTWEPENLINMLNGLGEYRVLPQPVRNRVEAQIRSRTGTLGDLLRMMSSPPPHPLETGMGNDQNPSM